MEAGSRERERAAFPGIAGSLGLVAAVLVGEVIAALLLRRSVLGDPDLAVLATALAIAIGNGVVLAIYFRRWRLEWRNVMHPAAASMTATVGVLAVPLLLLAPAIFLVATGLDDVVQLVAPMSESQRRMFADLLRGGFASALMLVLVAPLFEEMLFRGVVLRGLLARMEPRAAIVVSALIFGAAHLNWQQFVTGTFIGLPLGWLYWRVRSTLPCMLLHAAHNALTLVAVTSLDADASAADLPVAVWFVAPACAWAGAIALRRVLGGLRQSSP